MPFPSLVYRDPFHQLGPDFWDPVRPHPFVNLRLRYHQPTLLAELGMGGVGEDDLLRHFGAFEPLPGHLHGPLAQRYIGYQFQVFNPHLGDGRGFLLAQVSTPGGRLLDLGTKGSGTTPWSRGGDGFLTLKGGIRELIAAEFLYGMGVKTSRPFTLVEQEAKLWRGDEPSPTRSSILVRLGEGHIRFGTFERLYYLVREPIKQLLLMTRLADHVVADYYPHLLPLQGEERYLALFGVVVTRTADMVAGWINAGFCHGVLNTDNMSITGDSFDYGPWAFMQGYDPNFTAAYFDHSGLYAFERQPDAVYWNLAQLVKPFSLLVPTTRLEEVLSTFPDVYRHSLRRRLLLRLGFVDGTTNEDLTLLKATLELLRQSGCSFHGLFLMLRDRVACRGVEGGGPDLPVAGASVKHLQQFRQSWWERWQGSSQAEQEQVLTHLYAHNPAVVPWRPEVERVWEAIDGGDDWRPLNAWLEQLRRPFILPKVSPNPQVLGRVPGGDLT